MSSVSREADSYEEPHMTKSGPNESHVMILPIINNY